MIGNSIMTEVYSNFLFLVISVDILISVDAIFICFYYIVGL